jgi:hypothetical protein
VCLQIPAPGLLLIRRHLELCRTTTTQAVQQVLDIAGTTIISTAQLTKTREQGFLPPGPLQHNPNTSSATTS